MRELDRTATTNYLEICLTGVYMPDNGMSFRNYGVIGSVDIADVSDATWWVRFKTFISGAFTSLTNAMNTGFSNINSWITAQTTKLNNTLTNIWGEIETIRDQLTEYFGQDSTAAEDQSAEIETQVDELQGAVSEMDTVTKPNVDDIDVNAGAYVDAGAMATTGEVLNEFMMNEMVLTMMLIAATVGLGAFIVF